MVITIGGGYGSGGKYIALKLAELLNYTLCDDEIVSEAVANSNVDMTDETFRFFDESQGSAPLTELTRLSSIQKSSYIGVVSSLSLDVTPMDQNMSDVQKEVLTGFADKGNCILLGRCADHYLKGRSDVLSIFVIDNEENCTKRIMEHFPALSEKEAKKLIKKTDKRRADYYAFFTKKTWGDMKNYGLILNCEALGGADNAADIVAAAVRAKEASVY